ncbi:transposable element Tc3 transposase [Trichonephila clavipes]|nr:transposable element Tc3 transposase [Trichonephila clavipes]
MIKLPDHTLAEFLTNESIEWNFIPPRSPNHGGLWEAGVKAFKFHLKRVVGNAHLTLEEFITILCEIEAVLNSRPLTPLTSNFDDFETLTPGHFLVGRPLTSIVEAQITNINENQLSRWERVKKNTQHIYKLWKRDYLNNLQERHKWKFNKNNVSVGTLVLIKDENLPSTKWSTGRITEIFPGADDNLVALHFKYDQARRIFFEWAQNEIAIVPDFHKRILFSDEAHFWLNGYVNKQNCRIWSEDNPQVYVETPLHPEKLTVWCALWASGIIGPYFFKNDEGHNVTVNGDRYRVMITNFFIPELNNHDVQELWFQQNGATCHTARATINLLKDTFGDRLISRFGPVNWPPRSCDLTPLDYFLWGYVKSLVYADKPQTLDHLEDNIRRVIADIRPQMLEKVIENWTSRFDYIRASRGNHMPEIILFYCNLKFCTSKKTPFI